MTRKDQQLIWEAFQRIDPREGQHGGPGPDVSPEEYDEISNDTSNNLEGFIKQENERFERETGFPVPSLDRFPIVKRVSNNPLVQQYVATRLHYYGGGENKIRAAHMWAKEALSNPQQLD